MIKKIITITILVSMFSCTSEHKKNEVHNVKLTYSNGDIEIIKVKGQAKHIYLSEKGCIKECAGCGKIIRCSVRQFEIIQ